MNALKIGLICFLGALVGSLIALQVLPAFWWIGMFVGGIIGYFGYEPKRLLVAAWDAMRFACNIVRTQDYLKSFYMAGKMFFELLISVVLRLLSTMAVVTVIVVDVYVLTSVFLEFKFVGLSVITVLCSVFLSFLALAFAVAFVMNKIKLTLAFDDGSIKESFEDFFKILIFFNPASVVFFSLCGAWTWRNKILRGFKKTGLFLYLFTKKFFVLIHSDIRLLCGIDSAIGTAVGYYFGNAFVGAVIGFLWGAFNYHVVGIKILKVNIAAVKR